MQANRFAATMMERDLRSRFNTACVICLVLVSLFASAAMAATSITGVNVLNKSDRVVISVQGDAPLKMGVINSSAGNFLGFQFRGVLSTRGRLIGIRSGRIFNVRYSRFSENPSVMRIVVNTSSHLDYSTEWNDDKTQVDISVWKFGASPATQAPAKKQPAVVEQDTTQAAAESLPVLPPIDLRGPQGSDPGKPAEVAKPAVTVKPVAVARKPKAATTHIARFAPPATPVRLAQATSVPAASGAGKLVSLSFLGADTADVLKALATQSGENIVVGSDVTGTITVTLDSVTVEEALDYVTQLTGYTYVKDQHTYLVGSPESVGGLSNAKVEIVTLSYANADDVLEMLKTQCPQVRASKISVRGGRARKHDQTFEQGKVKADAQGQSNINAQDQRKVDANGEASASADGKTDGKDKSASGNANVDASGGMNANSNSSAKGSMNVNAKRGQDVLQSSASPDSPSSNMIALVGKPEKIASAKAFIDQVEQAMKDQSADVKTSVYAVKCVNTQELANTLMSIVLGITVTLAPSADADPNGPGLATKIIPTSLLSGEKTDRAFDTEKIGSSHTLIIIGKPEDVQKAMDMAAQFDVPGDSELATYRVKYVEVKMLADAVSQLVPGVLVSGMFAQSAAGGAPGGGAAPTVDLRQSGVDQTGVKQQSFMNAAALDNLSRTLILTGRKSDVEKAKTVLAALDLKSPQIKIDAKITSLTQTGEKKLGLSWNWSDFKFQESVKVVTGMPDKATNRYWRAPVDFGATLEALITNGDGKLLAAPSLMCLEGKPGQFFVGDQIRYVVLVQQTPQGNNVQTEVANVGIQLSVVGNASDDGYITLNLHPEVSVIQLTQDKEAGITLPTITRRYTDHVVRVKSGQTLVIGGLIKDDELDTLNKVPMLGDLPVLGQLFRHRHKTTEHSEVVMFITASIVND